MASHLPSHNPHTHKQCPLYFSNKQTDRVARHLTTFGNTYSQRIVYMGPRYTSTLQAFQTYGNANLTHSDQWGQVNSCEQSELYCKQPFQKYPTQYFNQKQKINPIRSDQYRIFRGMNPTCDKSDLQFDSDFQCGNLDLAVKVAEDQYDLFMRVDSNTKGHTCWFFFKVSQFKEMQTIKFNIINFSKKNLMYESGLKISTYSSSTKLWSQEGNQICFKQLQRIKYQDQSEQQCLISKKESYCLSFVYQSNSNDHYVYFAYSLPYSYSYLMHTVKELQTHYNSILEVDTSNQSTGGLIIPIITVTNTSNNNFITSDCNNSHKKPTCLIIGRLHPGQTQSNWLLHGFINFLCSPFANYLRDHFVFKILPMINVDGVVLGNFRTGVIGRDLNRLFHNPEMSKQVFLVRSLASQFNPFIFLDFHGHSSKKYIFAYGPNYSIDHRYFVQSRILPKLIQKSSKAFRYYACSFKISQTKSTTARSIMLKQHQVIYSYTIQTSVYGYGPKLNEKVFDQAELIKSGQLIGFGLMSFVKIVIALPKRLHIKQDSPMKHKRQQKGKAKSERKIFRQEGKDMNYEANHLFKEILDEEYELNKNDETNNEQNSDCEEGQDYTDKELTEMFRDQNISIKTHKKKSLKYHKKHFHSIKINKTITQNHISISPQEKRIQKKIEQKKHQTICRPIKLRLQKQLHCVSPFLDRIVFGRNKYSSNIISQVMENNKIFNKQSSNLFQQCSSASISRSKEKVTLVKRDSITYQPFSQSKNKEKQKAHSCKKYNEKRKQQQQRKSKIKMKQANQAMKLFFPLLGRSSNTTTQENKSLIQEIIERHEKFKVNKERRQQKTIPI